MFKTISLVNRSAQISCKYFHQKINTIGIFVCINGYFWVNSDRVNRFRGSAGLLKGESDLLVAMATTCSPEEGQQWWNAWELFSFFFFRAGRYDRSWRWPHRSYQVVEIANILLVFTAVQLGIDPAWLARVQYCPKNMPTAAILSRVAGYTV